MSDLFHMLKWNSRSTWMFTIWCCFAFVVLGVMMTSHVASAASAIALTVVSGQDVAGAANADYLVHYVTADNNLASQIIITFPSGQPTGYSIASGVVPTQGDGTICNNGCGTGNAISVGGSTVGVTTTSGNGVDTLTVNLDTPTDLSAGTVIFTLKSGITNPQTAGTYGTIPAPFTITTNATAEIVQSLASGIAIVHGDANHLKFSSSISSPKTAGVEFNLPSIEIVDQYGNRDTTQSPSGISISYVVSGGVSTNSTDSFVNPVSFTNGLSTTTLATSIYYAESKTIKVYSSELPFDTDGALATLSNSFVVNPGSLSAFSFSDFDPGSFVAGVAYVSTLTAADNYDNKIISYTGAHTITFTNSETSPDGIVPKSYVTGASVSNFGTPLSLNFTDGIADQTVTLIYTKSGNNSFRVTDGDVIDFSCSAGNNCLTIKNAAAISLRVAGGASSMSAGGEVELTVTAKDAFGNTVSGANSAVNYTGAKTLTFSGPSVSLNSDIATVEGTHVGTAQSVTFTNGVSNALTATLTAYKAEAVSVDVSDGALDSTGNAAYDLDLTVANALASTFTTALSDSTPTTGTPVNLTVTAKDQYGNTAAGVHGSGPVYTGMIMISTSASAPFTIQPSLFRFVSGDGGVKTFTNGITFNVPETVSVSVSDFNDGAISGTQSGIEVSEAPSVLAITGIDTVKSYATSDGTYADGFAWVLHVSIPTSESQLKLKFSDFLSGSNMIAATNIRYCSAQSDTTCASSGESSTDYKYVSAADQNFLDVTAMNLSSDLDLTTPGRQVQVRVEMKVPALTAGGSYSGSYGLESSTPAT